MAASVPGLPGLERTLAGCNSARMIGGRGLLARGGTHAAELTRRNSRGGLCVRLWRNSARGQALLSLQDSDVRMAEEELSFRDSDLFDRGLSLVQNGQCVLVQVPSSYSCPAVRPSCASLPWRSARAQPGGCDRPGRWAQLATQPSACDASP